jgi:hypothetical protein
MFENRVTFESVLETANDMLGEKPKYDIFSNVAVAPIVT